MSADSLFVGYPTLRSDLFLGDIKLGRGIVFGFTTADPIHLVVDRRTMVIAVLTGTGDGPLDVRRMPCSYTSNLSKTFVRLPRKLLGTPSARDALEAMTFCDGNAVDHLILFEDRPNVDRLLEETFAEVDFVRHRASVDLDLHQMSLLLLERCLANLGVRQDTDDCAILLDTFEFSVDGLARALGVLFGVFGEGLFL